MKKRIVIIGLIIAIVLGIVSIYGTLATNSTVSVNADNTYNVTLTNDSTISLPAKSSKIVYYQICNTNKGTVKYGVGYTSDNIVVKTYWDTPDWHTGLIDYGENKFIKLKIINNSNSDDTVTLRSVLGYEKGGDLIPNSNVTLISETIAEKSSIISENKISDSSSTFLGAGTIKRSEITEVTFEKDNIVPVDAILSKDISSLADGSTMLWYTKKEDNTYELHMGSDNGKVSITDGEYLFAYMENVEILDFSSVDLSKLTDMANMFRRCTSLKEIKFGNNVLSNITSLYYTFYRTEALTTIDLSGFDTSMVENMSNMFAYTGVEYLDLSSFDTGNVTNMYGIFRNSYNLISINLENFDTSNVTNMGTMFSGCGNLKQLDLSHFNTSQVTNMTYMFNGCTGLSSLDLSHFNTSQVTNMTYMFSGCTGLSSLDISSFGTSNLTSLEGMFGNCTSLITLDLSSFDTSNVTNTDWMFNMNDKLTTIYVSELWDMSLVTSSKDMLNGCRSIVGGFGTTYNNNYRDVTYARIDGGTSNPGYLTLKTN